MGECSPRFSFRGLHKWCGRPPWPQKNVVAAPPRRHKIWKMANAVALTLLQSFDPEQPAGDAVGRSAQLRSKYAPFFRACQEEQSIIV